MNRSLGVLVGSVAVCVLVGCGPREQPTLCVFSSADLKGQSAQDYACTVDQTSEDPAPGTADKKTLVQCPQAPIDEGQAYFLRHALPEGLVTIGTLKVHMKTPCATAERDIEATHVDGQFFLPFTPPQGASCAFLLTAVMAQSELSCNVVRTDVPVGHPCADIATLCAAAPANP